MAKTKSQQLEESTDAILRGTNPALHVSAPTQGERAGRRRDPSLFELSIDRIRPDAEQVRRANKADSDPAMQELAATIKDHGMLQPIDVRYVQDADYYKIVAGERRYLAANLAGLESVPVKLLDVPDDRARLLQIIENVHRADLLPTELGAALQELRNAGHTVEDLAKLLRKSTSYITKALSIAEHLSPTIKQEAGEMPERLQSLASLYEISKLPADKQANIWKQIKSEGLTHLEVRRATAEAQRDGAGLRTKRGRPAKTRPYRKTISTKVGAKVTIQFRKNRVSPEEVLTALKQAMEFLAA